jgi:hypothetical protein
MAYRLERKTMLIPTLYRAKLSKEFSYPVGAELLSESLLGVPHFGDFKLCFSDVVTAWKVKFQLMIAEGLDYVIIKARLWEPWEIYVYPVQRQLKYAARGSLIAIGLPMLRNWMFRHEPHSPLREPLCRVMFSPGTKAVYLRERVAGKERDFQVV